MPGVSLCSTTSNEAILPSSTAIATFIGPKPDTSYTSPAAGAAGSCVASGAVAAVSTAAPFFSAACFSASLIPFDVTVAPDTASNDAV